MNLLTPLQLQIWDTAGQERFRSITQSYYHSADALVLVFDVTSKESFNSLPSWLKEVEQYASPKVISVLVGKFSPRKLKTEMWTHFDHCVIAMGYLPSWIVDHGGCVIVPLGWSRASLVSHTPH